MLAWSWARGWRDHRQGDGVTIGDDGVTIDKGMVWSWVRGWRDGVVIGNDGVAMDKGMAWP